MKNLFLILITLFLLSCSDDNDLGPCIEQNLGELPVTDENGNPLFTDENGNSYDGIAVFCPIGKTDCGEIIYRACISTGECKELPKSCPINTPEF